MTILPKSLLPKPVASFRGILFELVPNQVGNFILYPKQERDEVCKSKNSMSKTTHDFWSIHNQTKKGKISINMTTYKKRQASQETTEYAITDYEELNDRELEKVAGGLPPEKTPDGWVVYVWCPPIPPTF